MTSSARTRVALAELLGQTLGTDKAAEVVNQAADELGFQNSIDRAQALAVLEHIARLEGIVGITARFAKSRVHLIWT